MISKQIEPRLTALTCQSPQRNTACRPPLGSRGAKLVPFEIRRRAGSGQKSAPAETIALVGDWLLAAKPYFAA